MSDMSSDSDDMRGTPPPSEPMDADPSSSEEEEEVFKPLPPPSPIGVPGPPLPGAIGLTAASAFSLPTNPLIDYKALYSPAFSETRSLPFREESASRTAVSVERTDRSV